MLLNGKRYRKIGVALSAYIVGGTLISLFVAWGIAWHRWSEPGVLFSAFPDVKAISELDGDGHGWHISCWHDEMKMIQVVERSNSFYDMRELGIQQLQAKWDKVPQWSKSHVLPTETEKESYRNRLEVVAGWPFLSWYGEYSHERHAFDTEQSSSAILVHKAGSQYSLALPFKPFMPGFIWSSFFYAILAMIAHLVVVRLMRFNAAAVLIQRRKKYKCTACAYDISGLTTCPECGQEVAIKPNPRPKQP